MAKFEKRLKFDKIPEESDKFSIREQSRRSASGGYLFCSGYLFPASGWGSLHFRKVWGFSWSFVSEGHLSSDLLWLGGWFPGRFRVFWERRSTIKTEMLLTNDQKHVAVAPLQAKNMKSFPDIQTGSAAQRTFYPPCSIPSRWTSELQPGTRTDSQKSFVGRISSLPVYAQENWRLPHFWSWITEETWKRLQLLLWV